MYQIEQGHAVPDKARRGNGTPVYPWGQMEIGDSFFVPDVSGTRRRAVTVRACEAHRKTGFKFCTRSENTGARVWRIG